MTATGAGPKTGDKGGYNAEFVETVPSNLICLICSFVTRQPHRMKCCDKLYCKSCLEDLRKVSDKCPNCQDQVDATSSFDQNTHSEIMALRVRCGNASKGCHWLDKLEELESHRSVCPKETTRCVYYEIGCRAKFPREEKSKHNTESSEHHFSCALDTITNLRKSHSEMKRVVHEIRQRYEPRKPVAVFKMQDFGQHKTRNKCWYSPSFLSHRGGYKMCLRVDANGISPCQGTHVSVFVCLMQGESDADLIWPFRGSVTVELLNQVKDANHHMGSMQFESHDCDECNSRVICVVSSTGRGWPQFIAHDTLYDSDISCQYLRDDSLYFRISGIDVYDTNKPWLSCTI